MLRSWKAHRAEIIAATIALILLLPFCGLLFGCGCTLLTGLKHCNIHDPLPPNCPWCSGSLASQFLPVTVVSLAAIAGPHIMRKVSGTRHFGRDVAVGLVVALLAAFVLAWIYALATGYPDFLLFR